MKVVLVIQVAPPLVDISTTPPSKVLSRLYWWKNRNCATVALAGIAIGAVVTSSWSEMLARSGAKAAPTPEWAVLVITQPQPPGTQVGTVEVNWPRPLSKPSLNVICGLH